jgi:hypothetical protein
MVACGASARGWPAAGSSAWGLAGTFERTIRRHHVCLNRQPAGAQDHASAALVPVDAVGLDQVVEYPALLVPASHARLARHRLRERMRYRHRGRDGREEPPSVQDASPWRGRDRSVFARRPVQQPVRWVASPSADLTLCHFLKKMQHHAAGAKSTCKRPCQSPRAAAFSPPASRSSTISTRRAYINRVFL